MAVAASKRQLILKMSMSLGGFVDGPNAEIDWVLKSSGSDSVAWVLNTLQDTGQP